MRASYRFVAIMFLICGMSTGSLAVQYRVTFDATWSSANHPDAYPGPSAHFSPLVGAAHNDSALFWEMGGAASSGIEVMAETGGTFPLRQELTQAIDAGNALSIVQGSTFDSPGTQDQVFEATVEFPLVTLVSMIAPSPDWFVGVSGLSLRDGDAWRKEIVVDLHPYDAGTEEGNRFSIGNPASNPHGVISRLDTDESSVLFESAPFGTFRFELMSLCDLNLDGACDLQDLSTSSGLYSVGDLEAGVVVVPGENAQFDLTGDGMIDGADLDFWLADAAEQNGFSEPYLKGDTNLNDHVGFGDFNTLSANFGTGREWSEGNYRGSGVTSFADFLLLAGNFGEAIGRSEIESVPEPASNLLAINTAIGIVFLMRRRVGS